MNYLIKNATVLTMDDGRIINNGYVLISDGYIKEVGEGDVISDGLEVIDAKGNVVMPGLINAHTHLPMTIFRGFADDLPLQEWLSQIWPVEDEMTDDDMYWCTMLALMESASYGVTTVTDMYMKEDSIARAIDVSGMRGVVGRSVVNVDNRADVRLDEARSLFHMCNDMKSGRLTTMVMPHAEYTTDAQSIEKCIALADECGVGIHVHLSETEREVKECIERHGCSPVKYFHDLGMYKYDTLAAHCVCLSDEDVDIMAENNVSVAHNPASNLKLASGIAPVPKMMTRGINVAIGTDGAGSNNCLDMWRDMYLAAVLHKGNENNPTAVTAEQALEMATVNGAKALGLNVGSIKVGMKADIIMVDMSSLWFKPDNEIPKLLVYSGTRANVLMTMIDGNIIYRNGEFLTMNREEVLTYVEGAKKRLGL